MNRPLHLASCLLLHSIGLTAAGAVFSAQISQFPHYEGFETSNGGFVTGGSIPSWAWGGPASVFIDEPAEGDRAWVTNLLGAVNWTEGSYLESPLFDFTALAADPFVQFAHIFDFGFSDSSWLEMSVDGGAYSTVGGADDPDAVNWYNNASGLAWAGTSGSPGEWRLARHRLDGSAGGMVRLRLHLEAAAFTFGEGVGVDNFWVFESLDDVGVELLVGPQSGVSLASTQPVSVQLTNQGSTEQSGFVVSYSVTGPVNSNASEVYTGVLAPVEFGVFTFASPADFSVPGQYLVTVSTSLASDEISSNDSNSSVVVHQGLVQSLPYLEDFESSQGMFIGDGESSSWEWGEPTDPELSGAASGARAWVTNLDGAYTESGFSYLVSPPFDLTTVTNDPFIQFSHRFSLETNVNTWLELSLDGGAFTKVGATDDILSINWYESSNDTWRGASSPGGQWRNARHILAGASGHEVVVRWVLEGTSSVSFRSGVAVDDVALFEAPFGNGQAARPGIALLDVNGATEAVGLSPEFGQPGPYFSAVSVYIESIELSVMGAPLQPIALYSGSLSVGSLVLPAFGQVDLAGPVLIASGLVQGGVNPLFVTDSAGAMSWSVAAPVGLIGWVTTFQAAVFNPATGVALSNAVQVSFLP